METLQPTWISNQLIVLEQKLKVGIGDVEAVKRQIQWYKKLEQHQIKMSRV